MNKKHILFLTPGFPADETDSQCIPALQVFTKAMSQQKNVDISVISLHYPQRHGQWQWHGMNVYSAFGRNKASIFFNAWKWIQAIHQKHPIDGIHCFWLNDAALLGYWLGRLKKIPVWVTFMGQDVRPSNQYLRFFPLKKMNTIVLSPFQNKYLFQTVGSYAKNIIPWGIDPVDSTRLEQERPFDIIGVGNLIVLKRYDLFIRLVARLKEILPNIRVVLIGDGPERTQLEQQVEAAQLTAQFKFTGAIPRTEVFSYMEQSKVFLHTSSFESFGLVFLEALAKGMQVVSQEVGIASASEKWKIASSEDGLFEALKQSLNNGQAFTPDTPFLIEDTVEAYKELYFKRWSQ